MYCGNTSLQIKKPQNSHFIPFKIEGILETTSIMHSSRASDMTETFAKFKIIIYSQKRSQIVQSSKIQKFIQMGFRLTKYPVFNSVISRSQQV